MVDITGKKKDGLHSATSNLCKWNHARKRKLRPKKAEELSFHKYNCRETSNMTYKCK